MNALHLQSNVLRRILADSQQTAANIRSTAMSYVRSGDGDTAEEHFSYAQQYDDTAKEARDELNRRGEPFR